MLSATRSVAGHSGAVARGSAAPLQQRLCAPRRAARQQQRAALGQQQQQQQHQQHQQQQQRARAVAARASNKDDEAFERMKREADGGDMWGSEIVATGLKIALVALFVTVTIVLLDAATPIIDTTVERFPTPQAY